MSFGGKAMSDDKKWAVCCRGRKCPEVLVSDEEVLIKDDDGGEVKLSFRDFDLIVEVVHGIRDNPELPK
jgi:hypothetical protein